MSNILWPHELQHSRLPCPLLCPRVCLNSCPFNQWCHPIIASSVAPYLSCLRLFQWVGTWHQVAKALELHLQHKSFQWIFRADFLWDWLTWSPCSPRENLSREDSQASPPTTQFKSMNSSALSLFHGPTLTSVHDHWKNHSFD